MTFTENDIRNAVKAIDFIKGKEYFQYGYVVDCEPKMENDTLLIFSSETRGSSHNYYQQKIQLQKTIFNTFKLHGLCSCPVGLNCKHVVAACLAYTSFNAVGTTRALNQWINRFKEAASPKKEFFPSSSE